MKPARLGFGIIGAGPVGCALASVLRADGHAIVGIVADTQEGRDRVQVRLQGLPILTPEEVVERSEAVILAIPDEQIEPTVAGLAALGAWQPGQLLIHTAAQYGTRPLAAAMARGVIGLAIHPAMEFTDSSLDNTLLEDCPIAVTASAAVQPIGLALAVEMGGRPVLIGEADRGRYAAALGNARKKLQCVTTELGQELTELMGEPTSATPFITRLLDTECGHVRDRECELEPGEGPATPAGM